MGKIRIAVADNNRDLCTTLAALIAEQEDIELVGMAHDGLEAIQMIEKTTPDVLVLDITMPYLDGIGVLERLEGFRERPIVIVLTAFEQESMIQRVTSLGATYYMVKPFDAPTLFERIRQFAGHAQLVHSTAQPLEKRASREVSREKTVNDLELEVSRLFHEMGIPAHFRGYVYLRDAIVISAKEVEVLGNITKNLYPRIAVKYNSTPSGVESAIRHTIEVTWERGNNDYLGDFFGFEHQRGRFPTTAAFIAKVADKLRLAAKAV